MLFDTMRRRARGGRYPNISLIYPFLPAYSYSEVRSVISYSLRKLGCNTFMLPSWENFSFLVDRMAGLNHGRVFLTEPGDLGKYILVDCINDKKTKI